MPPSYLYHPVWFYSITMVISLGLGWIVAYIIQHKVFEKLQFPLFFLGLAVPCIVALAMNFGSRNELLIGDFWKRLFLFDISPGYLAVILFLMPCVILLATGISLFFGFSADQFHITKQFSVMKGWAVLGIIIPIVLAPVIEELGWRGYGVDSLRAHLNLFNTSVIFGILWAAWHLPAFFFKGYYQNQLWHMGIVYVINFFVSVFSVAFLMNWIFYKTDRSIPAVILFHSVLNFSSMVFNTEQFTKCIATIILCVVTVIVIVSNTEFFFNYYDRPISSQGTEKRL